jgi:CrcB protein
MAVNLAGSFAAGLLYGWQMPSASPELYALAGIGFMGGMTTYSTLNVQKSQLAKEGNRKLLYICLLITYPGCILLAGLGVWTGKLSG